MFCPQCGQQQVSDEMRFCSRCGFALGVVTELIAHDGALASDRAENAKPSRRQTRMYKGLVLVAIGFLFTLICMAFTKAGAPLEVFATIGALLSGIVCFFGVFQVLIAYLSDEDARDEKQASSQTIPGRPARLDAPARRAALPQAQGTPATDWRPRPQTAEMAQPASVTENTTRLLDDETTTRRD
ncbi:MAG TPA: hypothetical protein VGO91_06305 [Pyrinomonadaceae bacterium]|jgi:hypothetical protein|nr:hypothetical protein [Pyrinomonadaceae bacterium]